METMLSNLNGKVRRVSENGKQFLVAPATLLVPGILNGSKGPLYYPPEECAATANAWDGMPLTVYHPIKNGQPTTASESPQQHVGFVRKPSFSNKTKGEAWFDVEKVKRIDNLLPDAAKIMPRLERGQKIELSTGLYTDNEERAGQHNGRDYVAVARNHRPDHLAVLPDQVGACSINDGCGIMVNQFIANAEAVTNPAVSEAQRRYLNMMFGHDWVRAHGFDNEGELPEKVENSDQERDEHGRFAAAAGATSKAHEATKALGEKTAEAKLSQAAVDADKRGDHSSAANFHGQAAQRLEKKGKTYSARLHRAAQDAQDAADRSKRLGTNMVDDKAAQSLLRRIGVALGLVKNYGNETDAAAKLTGTQARHPKDGTYQGKPDVAAKRGYAHTGGHQQPPADDPDDDGDHHPEIGQGDREPEQRGTEEDVISDDDAQTIPKSRANTGIRQVRNAMDPHMASKQAAAGSMDHGPAHDFASQAVAASNDGNSKKAASFHMKAADAHQQAATEARSKGDEDDACCHDDQAAAHMKAASMHNATMNANPNHDDKGRFSSGSGGGGGGDKASAKAASQKAYDHSDLAGVTGSKSDHAFAAMAHDKAAEAQSKAGNSITAAGHRMMAAQHEKAAGITSNRRRPTMIPQDIIDNCSCESSRAAMIAYNEKAQGSNADSPSDKGSSVMAGGKGKDSPDADYEDDEDDSLDDGTHVGDDHIHSTDKGNMGDAVKNRFLQSLGFNSQAEAVATLNMAKKIEREARHQRAMQLVNNSRVTDAKQRKGLYDRLMRKNIAELDELLLLQPAPMTRNQFQRDDVLQMPTFIGNAGGPVDNSRPAASDADDIMDTPTINWKEEVA